MARMALLGTSAFASAALAQSRLALSRDNSLQRYRQDASLFYDSWKLSEGSAPSSLTDMALHRFSRSVEATWVDYLYPLQWETDFQGSWLCTTCRSFWWLSYVAAALYLIGLWIGQASMKDRKAYNLKTPLALWNLFLTVFSFIGAARTAPHLLMLLWNYGFDYTVCRVAAAMYGNGACGFWVALFIFSKYFELIDTVFLVLRKKSVLFLHWYHHCSVLLYCWHAYVWEMPTGIYFASMNYVVHAIMYFYYFLAAVCKKPPKWGLLVTILQLLQMAIGIGITLSHLTYMVYGIVDNCDGHIPNLAAALCMYASYFALFAQFLGNRYCRRRSRDGENKNNGTKKSQ